MVTIKTKKEMNLPELIEWAWDNDITNKEYICNEYEKKSVIFNLSGWAEFSDEFSYNPHDTFTVDIEEPITEDTVFDKLISRYVFLSSKPSYAHSINTSIKEVIEYRKVATHIYLENEDNELQLIWTKEKGLVE